MKLLNKDMTKESVTVYVTRSQIYAEVFCKSHGKWEIETYFKDYGFEVDEELTNSSIKEIKKIWGLKNPKVVVEF